MTRSSAPNTPDDGPRYLPLTAADYAEAVEWQGQPYAATCRIGLDVEWRGEEIPEVLYVRWPSWSEDFGGFAWIIVCALYRDDSGIAVEAAPGNCDRSRFDTMAEALADIQERLEARLTGAPGQPLISTIAK